MPQKFYMIWNKEAYLPPAAKLRYQLFRDYILTQNNADDAENMEDVNDTETEPS